MRRVHCCFAVLLTTVAVTASGAPALGATTGKVVDNSTLNPPASDIYTCYADGRNTICRGEQNLSGVIDKFVGRECQKLQFCRRYASKERYAPQQVNFITQRHRCVLPRDIIALCCVMTITS